MEDNKDLEVEIENKFDEIELAPTNLANMKAKVQYPII